MDVWGSGNPASPLRLLRSLPLSLNRWQVQRKPIRRRWFNLYGSQDGVSEVFGDNKELMNKMPSAASNYRGRVLLSVREDKNVKLKEPEVQ